MSESLSFPLQAIRHEPIFDDAVALEDVLGPAIKSFEKACREYTEVDDLHRAVLSEVWDNLLQAHESVIKLQTVSG